MIRPYLSNMINNYKIYGKLKVHSGNKIIDYRTSGEWTIQLTMLINFMSSKDSEETHNMCTKSHNAEILMGSETDDIIKEFAESLLPKYQEGLEEKMRVSEFIFDSADLLYYQLHKINLKRPRSCIDSPKQQKNKEAKIYSNNKDNKSFQYDLTVTLNYQNIKKNTQRISKIKPFINQYDWKEIDFLSPQKDWKNFELNNKSIVLNILFVLYNTEKIRFAYKSGFNFKHENQVILLIITNGKKIHYLAVESLSALLRGVTSNHNGYFCCLNCFHSYSTEKELKKHEKVCNDHDYCYVEMLGECSKTLK